MLLNAVGTKRLGDGLRLEPSRGGTLFTSLWRFAAIEWDDDDYKLGQIPNLHSVIPYSLEARKPVFDCTSADGLRGAHIKRAADSDSHFETIVETLATVAKD